MVVTNLKNDGVSWDDDIPNMWKNNEKSPKCSKPPTRLDG
jgi:hypothetical protein